MADLTPNGSTGTFVLACWQNPQDLFNYEEMNVLAENTSFLCQEYSTLLSGYYNQVCVSGAPGRPTCNFSSSITNYSWMLAGTYKISCTSYPSIGTGTAYTGTISIDGTTQVNFIYAGTTSESMFVNTSDRWIKILAKINPSDVTQTIGRIYWVGARRLV